MFELDAVPHSWTSRPIIAPGCCPIYRDIDRSVVTRSLPELYIVRESAGTPSRPNALYNQTGSLAVRARALCVSCTFPLRAYMIHGKIPQNPGT